MGTPSLHDTLRPQGSGFEPTSSDVDIVRDKVDREEVEADADDALRDRFHGALPRGGWFGGHPRKVDALFGPGNRRRLTSDPSLAGEDAPLKQFEMPSCAPRQVESRR
jgi:hypothetical protein